MSLFVLFQKILSPWKKWGGKSRIIIFICKMFWNYDYLLGKILTLALCGQTKTAIQTSVVKTNLSELGIFGKVTVRDMYYYLTLTIHF